MNQESATGIFYALFENIRQVTENLLSLIFTNANKVFFNGLSYSMIGLIALFWLLKRIHKGGIDKEEAYQAIVWITIVTIVYVIMSDIQIYYEFLHLLYLPINYVSSITMGNFVSGNPAETFGTAIDTLNLLLGQIYDNIYAVVVQDTWQMLKFTATIATGIYMVFWGLMYIIYILLIISITSIIIVSQFMANIILSLAPIMIPCLMVTTLRPYFFAWFKLFLSYSLFAPIAMAIGNFPIETLRKIDKSMIQDSIAIIDQLTYLLFIPLGLSMIAIIGIIVLSKIPAWINQVIGTQNNDSVGLAPLKATALAVGTAGAGYIAARAGGASVLSSIGKGIGESIPFGNTAGALIKGGVSKGVELAQKGALTARSYFYK